MSKLSAILFNVMLVFAFILGIQMWTDVMAQNDVELVRPEAYAVRRFAEVVDEAQKETPNTLQEQLIRQRALLELAKMRRDELHNPTPEKPAPENKVQLLKSVAARIDYHEKKIRLLEARVLKKRK